MEQPKISGIAYQTDEAKLTIRGVPDQPGVAYQILGPVSDAHINVDIIIQNVSADGTANVTFTVHKNDYQKSMDILNNTAVKLGATEIIGDDNIAKISVGEWACVPMQVSRVRCSSVWLMRGSISK